MFSGFSKLFKPRVEALGLEIGAANLKLVELSGNPPALRALATRPTPPGMLVEGVIAEPQALAQELKELLAEARTKKRYVVTAVPNPSVILRTLQVPKMPLKEMEEAVRWEAERYIPFPIDEVVLDFAPLDPLAEVADGEQVEVMVGAARQEAVASLLEALRGAGLTPIILDVKPFAGLYPLEAQLSSDPEGVSVAVEIGAESTSLVLLKGDRPLAVRILTLSGKDFTEAIGKSFGLDFLTAEEVKRTYGLATIPTEDEELLLDFDAERERYSPAKIYDAIRPILVELTQEIRRSLEFFRVQLGDIQPEVGYLYGGGSRLRGLPTLLTDTLGVNFTVPDPWQGIQVDPRRFDLEKLKELGPEFMVPVGLALRGVMPLD
ncbi:pilus assembly protein PilM [Thermus scotoductus]|uniref:Pilus assembly protein PilM n=1 Tax=Thermus scotoductus TaxID=37636 RepID=A0A430UHW0_THESC|nr:type IV pilus assembly protein PilM [Thermus scotoductus]RTG96474.1 pilus assembly protein PilM [Thermus scotoductus]RTH01884.1 pilus assembly protein PilM [Thermus scotoductus]RTH03388.1 pilus assembly protein PilM [Thermus scotoductus]RTH23647.1 pilus assembly protein PilM [Thermus scotoductus]RTH99566.1 pilus assembly protein PilM [Thermus scotoductus]